MWLTFLYQVILFETWQTRFWSKKIVKHSRFGRSDAILSTISTFQRTLMILLSISRRIGFNRVQSSIFVSLLWEDISLLTWFSSAGKMKFISLQVVVIKWTDGTWCTKICVYCSSWCKIGDELFFVCLTIESLMMWIATFRLRYCKSSSGDEVDCLRTYRYL